MRKKNYTVLIRKSELEYVAVCLELNIVARGTDLVDIEENLKNAIEAYLADVKEHTETVVSPISTEELIEFLKDTKPKWIKREKFLRPLEVHEVPSYV